MAGQIPVFGSKQALEHDGDLVLAVIDHSSVPNPLERALIQRLLRLFCSGRYWISRRSHNRHNVIL